MRSFIRRRRIALLAIWFALVALACNLGTAGGPPTLVPRLTPTPPPTIGFETLSPEQLPSVGTPPPAPDAALVDGNRAPGLSCPVTTVIKGDGRSLSIAAASIVAKVTRDRRMTELDRRYPGYGWSRNQGYGTAEHRAAIARLGVTPEHRRSFRPVREALDLNI